MANELYVLLELSENSFLTYPCYGWLELFEIGNDGSLIKAVFRRDPNPDSKEPCFSHCPVETFKPVFKFDNKVTKFRKQNRGEFSV